MYNITGKEPVFFEGVWIPDCESINTLKSKEISIRGTQINHIINTILRRTSKPGFIEIYEINISKREVRPVRIINVLNELEFCG
ncbi:MAG: hypothetical protein ACOC44_06165 [Promethearchaeia archaeon]